MGLDMYLTIIEKDSSSKDGSEVCYWRKANQIRKWFVDHAGYPGNGNCESVIVSKELLEELVKDCNAVLDNHELAPEILPTSDGFFFGEASYDDWYFHNLKHTVDKVSDILQNTDFERYEIEYSDWW